MTEKQEDLSQSLEDYLEAILYLEERHEAARVKQIADMLQVRMPSVTNALKHLREKSLVNYRKNSSISLTKEGKELAKQVTHRHRTIRTFLKDVLKLGDEDAEETACRIEHVIGNEFTIRLSMLNRFFKTAIAGTPLEEDWVQMLEKMTRP